jgi:hypothetical protein
MMEAEAVGAFAQGNYGKQSPQIIPIAEIGELTVAPPQEKTAENRLDDTFRIDAAANGRGQLTTGERDQSARVAAVDFARGVFVAGL